jgi:hypothetical protein
MPPGVLIIVTGSLLSLLCLWGALHANRKRRLIQDIPTIKTAGVFVGLVELKGSAESERPLVSHLVQAPCVYFRWSVEEHWSRTVHETYTDSDGKTKTRTRHESGWTTVANGGEEQAFYLRDDCGVIRVNPQRAKLEPTLVFDTVCGPSNPLYYGKGPSGAISHSDYQRRFVEYAIPLHAPLYVLGQAREREDVVAPEVAYDPGAPLFLISTRSEAQVSGGYAGQYWVLALLGVLLSLATCWAYDRFRPVAPRRATYMPGSDFGPTWSPESSNDPTVLVLTFAGVGAAYIAAWLLAWVWMVFNSLVDLRQRVRQAWANVDVQLKRRSDLIPNLVHVIEGLRDYERQVQTELAELRRQLGATAPGQPGPDPGGCAVHLRAVIEKYPELSANDAFMNLQRNLVDTEQRISLARGYFNSIATFYNSRLEIVPDRFAAALAHMRPQPLIVAENFERATVDVTLAT